MGVFDIFKKKSATTQITMYGYENGRRVKLNESAIDEDPEYTKWYISAYPIIQKEIKPIEDAIVQCAVQAKNSRLVDERISALKGVVKHYYLLRDKCASLGSGYKKYFLKMWEHCSKNNDFYVTKFEKELQELQENYQELKQKELIHSRESKNLDHRVFSVLAKSPGILQTDVYKCFCPEVKDDIQTILYFWERDGKIRREKSGRTYKIYLKK